MTTSYHYDERTENFRKIFTHVYNFKFWLTHIFSSLFIYLKKQGGWVRHRDEFRVHPRERLIPLFSSVHSCEFANSRFKKYLNPLSEKTINLRNCFCDDI